MPAYPSDHQPETMTTLSAKRFKVVDEELKESIPQNRCPWLAKPE